MNTEYYIVESGERRGPYSFDALASLGLNKETLVWRQGLADWTKAADLQELDSLWNASGAAQDYNPGQPSEPYFAMLGGQRIGPSDPQALAATGISPDTPVWRNGMQDWAPASTQPELMAAINGRRQSVPPMPGQASAGNAYYGQSGYSRPGQGQPFNPYKQHTNWLPWAVGGTVVGFLFSCIGVIFGIIGIVQANKANEAFAVGNEVAGEQANNTAKTMTIIALAFGGVGLITTVVGTVTGLFSALATL